MARPEEAPILAPPLPTDQLTLFYRKTLIECRPSGKSLDCAGDAEADDGIRYHLKIDAPGKHTRASEWLSTYLAEAVGIAGPAAAPIEMLNGHIVFGSRHISGVSDDVTTTNYLLRSTLEQEGASNLSRILSSIYAFDLFINNEDRHLGNYLTVADGEVRRLYAIDYSRAFFYDWPWNGFPMVGSRTRDAGRLLRSCHGFDAQAAEETLVRLSNVSVKRIRLILEMMPSEWLPASKAKRLEELWTGGERAERIAQIRKGLGNDWLL